MVDSEQPSEEELNILKDTRFLTLKESVSTKIIAQLADIERAIKSDLEEVDFPFPENALLQAGKISKGENYRGLPYFVLDFPRLFTQKSIFTFRTMLWWGHEFSCTMHLSGEALRMINQEKLALIKQEAGLYFGVNHTPWEYHFEKDNFQPVESLSVAQMSSHMQIHNFIKISRFIPVANWDQHKPFTLETFARFLMLLK